MSQENVEVVKSLLEPFQAINTAEIDWGADAVREALAAKCSPDIEIRTLDSGIGTGIDPVYRGLAGVARYLGTWIEPFSEFHSTWIEFIDAGDFVLVPNSHWGLGKGRRQDRARDGLRLRGEGRADHADPPVRHPRRRPRGNR
jgi:hypothetical protein